MNDETNNPIEKLNVDSSKLDWELRKKVSEPLETVRLNVGVPIFNQDETVEKFLLIQNGLLGLYRFIQPDKRILLRKVLPEETVGVTELLLDKTYPAHLQPIKESVAYEGKLNHLEDLAESDPELLNKIVLLESQSHGQTYRKIQHILSGNVPQRIARELLELADRIGRETDNGIEIVVQLTRKEISRMIGCSKESVSRTMSQWEKEGTISTENKCITITKKRKLQSLLKDS